MNKVKSVVGREIVLSLVMVAMLAATLLLQIDDMADMSTKILAAALLVAFTVFAIFVWRERPRDEREELLLLQSSKVSYLVGAGTLVLGTAYQVVNHSLSAWLPVSLVLMVLSKAIGLRIRK